jgi:hypothetical protein
MESMRLKAILFGPVFIVIGFCLIPMISVPGGGVIWQMAVAAPAAIIGGIALLWMGLRSKPASPEETAEAATDVAKDIIKGIIKLK